MKDAKNHEDKGNSPRAAVESKVGRKRRITEAELEVLRYRGILARKPETIDGNPTTKPL